MASSDDYKFLLSCLVNNSGKIDFEAVARETGYTNPRSASNRLAAIKKNHAAAMAAAASGASSLTASSSREQPLAAPAAPPPQAQSAAEKAAAKRRVNKKAKAVKRGHEGSGDDAGPEDKGSKKRKENTSGD